MEAVFVLVAVASFVAGGLTLLTGFGLATLVMPVFALFFPLPVAIGATAVVHLASNLFKLALVGRDAHRETVIRFGLPAVIAALGGAALLAGLGQSPPLAVYQLGGLEREVTLVELVVGLVIAGFAVFDLGPWSDGLQIDKKWAPLGGALSGFFGGLSGHQGALRSAWMVTMGLSKEAFVATGAVVAAMVDASRLVVYGAGVAATRGGELPPTVWGLVAVGCLAAFGGSLMARKWLRSLSIDSLRKGIGLALGLFGMAIAAGLV